MAPPSITSTRAPTIDDLRALIIEEGCGFRPARKNTVLLDSKMVETPSTGRPVPVISNYGYVPFFESPRMPAFHLIAPISYRHGGYGFQSSWASAARALKLLEESLASSS